MEQFSKKIFSFFFLRKIGITINLSEMIFYIIYKREYGC